MTGIELVQEVFPTASNEIAEYMLWNCTSYPFGSGDPNLSAIEYYKQLLERLKQKSGGDVQKAIDISFKEVWNGH